MGKKYTIIINNNKSRLIADIKLLNELRMETRIRAKGYFWSPAFRSRQWDGYINYITEKTGMFETGLLKEFVELLKSKGHKVRIEDRRETFTYRYDINNLGGLELFGHQKEALDTVLNNKIEKVRFQRGILDEATNAGKSLIAGGIFSSLAFKRNGLFLVHGKDLYDQALEDLRKLLPSEQVGELNSKKFNWQRINVCMVQTLANRLKKDPSLRAKLAKQDAVIVDEVDEVANRKDCKEVLKACFNATIRIGLTGTAGLSKDKNRNKALIAWFGPILHSIRNIDLTKAGISSEIEIRIFNGNKEVEIKGDWKGEYEDGVIRNKKRHKRVWKRVSKHISKKRLPILVMFKNHKHGERLLKSCPKEILEKYSVKIVHHKTPDRKELIQKFKDGNIDILIASMIIRRGKNLPLTRVLINAAGGDSHASILQLLGRILRKDKTTKKKYMEDFWDKGKYLRRHSYHRVKYYKKEGYVVKELYK